MQGKTNELYELKNRVIDKLITEEKLKLKGYDLQKINASEIYLAYYTSSDNRFGYHLIEEVYLPEEEELPGNIEGVISSQNKIKRRVKYSDAVDVLTRYLN